MVDVSRQPDASVMEAILVAAAQPPASQNPLDVLLTYQDAVLAYEKAGKTGLGLWNIFRAKGVLACTYQNFNRALGRFRARFGLPAPYSRRRIRLEAAGRSFAPSEAVSNSREAVWNNGCGAPLLPPEPPRRRSAEMVPVNGRVASALHAVSVQKMHAAL